MSAGQGFEPIPVAPRDGAAGFGARFAALPLHHRFALIGSVVTLIGMLVIGSLVSSRIEASVVRNAAISSAVYMESFIAPLSQELAEAEVLSAATIARMNRLLNEPPLSDLVISAKIWRKGGLLAYATDADLIGRTFAPSDHLARAWRGELTASFDELEDAENLRERLTGVPLLEVYNPIHSIVTGEIIAVAEFYLEAAELRRDLRAARTTAWTAVAAVTLATFLALFGIVRSGGRTIDRQNRELSAKLGELARVSAQNEMLRERARAAALRASETNERYMRRISAELHDGPAQALALASLRFDALAPGTGSPEKQREAAELKASLDEALRDVRNLCHGLTLPELEGRSIAETLEIAASAHERRSGARVERRFAGKGELDVVAPHPILICIYRFLQEGLMNGYLHAGGHGQAVEAALDRERVTVSVVDAGAGFDPHDRKTGRLGLSGLRQRIESIGGEFTLDTAPGKGTRLTLSLPCDAWR